MTIKVCIDAGHGGKDQGAVNGGRHESLAALAIAKKVGSKLKAKGASVKYTRTSDRDLTLSDRCRISNDFDADAFVSIHLNAATNKDASGIETWRFDKVGSKTKNLADTVQAELIAATGAKNRGVKTTTSLYVLKHTITSAVLVECGFLSNIAESRLLFSDKYQEKVATAIANGVVKALA